MTSFYYVIVRSDCKNFLSKGPWSSYSIDWPLTWSEMSSPSSPLRVFSKRCCRPRLLSMYTAINCLSHLPTLDKVSVLSDRHPIWSHPWCWVVLGAGPSGGVLSFREVPTGWCPFSMVKTEPTNLWLSIPFNLFYRQIVLLKMFQGCCFWFPVRNLGVGLLQ